MNEKFDLYVEFLLNGMLMGIDQGTRNDIEDKKDKIKEILSLDKTKYNILQELENNKDTLIVGLEIESIINEAAPEVYKYNHRGVALRTALKLTTTALDYEKEYQKNNKNKSKRELLNIEDEKYKIISETLINAAKKLAVEKNGTNIDYNKKSLDVMQSLQESKCKEVQEEAKAIVHEVVSEVIKKERFDFAKIKEMSSEQEIDNVEDIIEE